MAVLNACLWAWLLQWHTVSPPEHNEIDAASLEESRPSKRNDVAASLKSLLVKIDAREEDSSGFNQLIKDAIEDKLRESRQWGASAGNSDSGIQSSGRYANHLRSTFSKFVESVPLCLFVPLALWLFPARSCF